ncbi:response regulator [Algibacillus agarilyticus]|uniref:response regulator n=1 Tax=Algibacillus agarilyticus TaxID=2234133 RepID=UPI000DD08031|nr:response regulator [Algibacillus agarilyticus]
MLNTPKNLIIKAWGYAILVFLCGSALTFYLYQTVAKSEYERARQNIENRANAQAIDIEAELKRRYLQISSVGNMFASAKWVSYSEFNDLITLVYEDFPNDRRVTWLAKIPYRLKDDYQDKIRTNPEPLFKNFHFFNYKNKVVEPLDSNIEMINAVIYTFPEKSTPHFLGRNIGAHSPIMKQFKYALNRTTATVSEITLAPPPADKSPIFLIFIPVIKPDVSGLVLSSNFISSSFINTTYSNNINPFTYILVDHKNNHYLYPDDQLVIADKAKQHVKHNSAENLTFEYDIDFVDKKWQLHLITQGDVKPVTSTIIKVLVACGSFITLILTYLAYSMTTRQLYLQELVDEQTERLSEALHLLGNQKDKLKEQNTALEDAVVKANAAVEAKANFLANMSHEIRTPMNGVIGMANLCRQTQLTPQQDDYLSKIQISASHLTTVINDILDFSKIESGKLTLEHHPFSIYSIIDSIKATLGNLAESKKIALYFELEEGLFCDLIGDCVRVNQVLINLCSNAIKFTNKGSVTVRISAVRITTENENNNRLYTYHFSVEDTGIGIKPDKLESLFDAFTQADTTTTRQYGGTGLGLSISQKLCHIMQGNIAVESVIDEGSCFTASMNLQLNNNVITSSSNNLQLPNNINILAIDDNPIALEIIHFQLSNMGANVTCVSSAEQALIYFDDSNRYNLIILDWTMPKMGGHEFLQKMKQLNLNNIPPVIVLSAYSRDIINTDTERQLIYRILQKPCPDHIIFDAISQAVEGAETPLTQHQKPLQNLAVLVAEDNEINQQIIQEILKQQGAHVTLVNNGLECIKAVQNNNHWDVILMDIQMPVMDGITATKQIRNELQLTELPIVALTANVMAQDVTIYLESGMNAHLCKPIEIDKVIQTLQALLTNKIE